MIRRSLAAAALVALLAACGPPSRPSLPSGAGDPFPEFAAAYEEAIAECAALQTITAELSLSGRAGTTKLRGRIDAGLAAPADIVLEGRAPVGLGKPIFILIGRGDSAMLFLPRDNRILRGAEPSAIVEALAGVALSPAELRSAVAGCGLQKVSPTAGRAYGNEWASLDSDGGTIYLRRVDGRWRIAAAIRDAITLQYGDFKAGRHGSVFIKTGVADLAMRVRNVEINAPIDPRVFDYEVPKDAAPLTLEELRRAGPLGDHRGLAPLPGPDPASGAWPRYPLSVR